MKKRMLPALAAVMLLLSLNACKPIVGKGPVKDEVRTVSTFSAIHISAPVKAMITVREGATAAVQLSGYENLLKEIRTEIRDNTLIISLPDNMRIDTDKDVVANITIPSLSALELSGASDAQISGKVTGNEFRLDISGSSDVTADDVSTAKFSVDVSGSGNVEVKSGAVQEVGYEVSGSGSIVAFGLQSQHADVSVSGAGNVQLTALQELEAAISGAGDVQYKGHPRLSKDISGAGSLADAN